MFCFIVFHVIHVGNFHVVSDSICFKLQATRLASSQVLKTRLARSSGSPPYAQKLLQGWVPASDFAWYIFSDFSVVNFFVHFW